MKYTVAIAAFAAVAAAQSSSSSSSGSSSSPTPTTREGGNTGIPYPTIPDIPTPTITELSALSSLVVDLASDLSSFATSLTAQADYSAFTKALGSAAAKSQTAELLGTGGLAGQTDLLASLATATPTWWTKLPTSAQAYYTSVAAAEVSIISSDFQGAAAAPTPAPVMRAAGVAAAGALAGAALLL